MHSVVYFGPGSNSTNGVVSAGFNTAKSAESRMPVNWSRHAQCLMK